MVTSLDRRPVRPDAATGHGPTSVERTPSGMRPPDPRFRRAPVGSVLLAVMLGSLLPHPSLAQARPDPAGPVLIRNVTVVDATGSRDGVDVRLRDGRVEAVAPSDGAPFDGRVIEGGGGFLIPGLVDAHVHVGHLPRAEMAELLEWVVDGGVTALRDMAGDARALAGTRQALLTRELRGPRLHYAALLAGPPFLSDPRLEAATRGYASGEAPYMIPVTARTDVVRAVAMAKGTGATGLKLYAALDAERIAAVTREAHAAGLQVWAHSAVFPARPVEVLDAGVDGVSHAPYLIWEARPPTPDFTLRARGDFAGVPVDGPAMDRVIAAMVRNGTVLDPTLLVFERNAADDSTGLRLEWGAALTRRAHAAGVPLAAGTDGVGDPDTDDLPAVHRELELLVELAGLTPVEALVAGTLGGARVLGIDDRFGTVEVGKVADLVLLTDDPRADIRATRSVRHVLLGGRVVR